MFSFEPADKGLYRSGIDDNVEQRFVVRFGAETLKNRLFVVLDKENIRFLYYDNDEQTETLNADYLKEVGYISLNYQKYTGNDILDFPQMSCGDIKPFPKEEHPVKPIIDSFKELFHGFPFLENIKDKKDYSLCNLLKCCLLAFVFKIEDRSEVFAQSPLYEHVRDTLRKSDVYQMLSAKIQYTLSVPKEGVVYDTKEYSYKARKYADCLMSQRINKVIFPHNYGNFEGKQGWFYDPEEELDAVLELNRKQEKDGQCTLDENLVRKIRDFLYTKHAVFQAQTKDIGKYLFNCAQVLMGITSIMIILSGVFIKASDFILHQVFPCLVFVGCILLFTYKDIVNIIQKNRSPEESVENSSDYQFGYSLKGTKNVYAQFRKFFPKSFWLPVLCCFMLIVATILFILYNSLSVNAYSHVIRYLFYIIVVVNIVIWLFYSGISNKGVAYAFFPRIIVAEAVGWLTIGIAEDLVKSMLWIEDKLVIGIALLVVLIVVGVLILVEGIQHSPYKKTLPICGSKVLPIVNHSLFFALIIGLFMQAVFYDNLIKNSGVIADTGFGEYFDDVDLYCQNLEDLESAVNMYQEYCYKSELNNKLTQLEKKSQKPNTVFVVLAPSIITDNKKENNSLIQSDTNILSLKIEEHNALVKHNNAIVGRLNELYKNMSIHKYFDTLAIINTKCSNDSIYKKQMEKNKKIIKGLPIWLQEEIANVRTKTLDFNDYETLMSWATIGINTIAQTTGSAYLDSLTIKAKKERKCCKVVFGKWRIFPTLLIFHSLIVLLIAFVGQLIISDKSVTEPL